MLGIGVLAWGAMLRLAAETARPAPVNLARSARASAGAEYSAQYAARFAIDGVIPGAGCQADTDRAWCAPEAAFRGGLDFTLEWDRPVTAAQIVYYGRVAWFAEECARDYAVMMDGAAEPVASGRLARGMGPQSILLPHPVQTRRLTLRFTGSWGGMNPGAAEIEVYGERLATGLLPPFVAMPPGTPRIQPALTVEEDPALREAVRHGGIGIDDIVVVQRHELNPSHVYTYHVEDFGPGGGIFRLSTRTGRRTRLADAGVGQILDCDVSYDGRRILFSKRDSATEGYHVWVANADGSGLRRLTAGRWHDYNPCWLPDGGIAFLSTRRPQFAYCWISPIGLLHRMNADGTGVRRLSANIVNDFTPSVMPDGRILYSRWEYVDRPAIPIQKLWTINPDGTGLAAWFGNRVLSPATLMEAHAIPGRSTVLCTLTSHNGPARGAIGIIDPARGVNAQSAIRNITPDVAVGRVDRGDGNQVSGPYENPFPLDDSRYLLSIRGTVALCAGPGGGRAVLLRPADGMGFYSPRPLAARRRPPVIPSHLPAPTPATATVVLQDVYRGLEPEVRRGEIDRICVVEELSKNVRTDVGRRAFGFQFPVISCGATYAAKKVWGFAPVAADGSAAFRVPAGVPIYFLALDRQGRTVQRMRTFTHLMPGETQGCTGCHDHGNASPRGAPTRSARIRAAAALSQPSWGVRGFDYAAIVQPVLDRRCAGCHSGAAPAAGVDLAGDHTDYFNVSYETLARGRRDGGMWDNPFTRWIPTYNGFESNILQVAPREWGSPRSRLAEIVLAGHPDAAGRRRAVLTEDERRRILLWIDLNVPYYGTAETAYPDNEGCRRIMPVDLERTLADVSRRRCASCHPTGPPRQVWTRITHPELNAFLTAPLAPTAGGSGRCGASVFRDASDPDYRAILRTFEPVAAQLSRRPRMDMPGAAPAPEVNRSCQ